MAERKTEGPVDLWKDPEFPPTDASIGKDAIPEDGRVVWLRPQEYADAKDVVLFDGREGSGDVESGSIDDAYFLGALSAVASHPKDLIEDLFGDDADDLMETGALTVRFYLDGQWVKVKIDTLIPCHSKTRTPIFGHSRHLNEIWVVLLEKAYAKVRGSYANLSGGSADEVLVELTGGAMRHIDVGTSTLLLPENSNTDGSHSTELWNALRRSMDRDFVVGCSRRDAAERGTRVVGDEDMKADRMCSVVFAKEIKGHRFVKIRNPWVSGAEWKGDWSRVSEMWEENPKITRALESDEYACFTREDDGTYWMLVDDFLGVFSDIHICYVFPSSYSQYLIKGEWNGPSAGGKHESASLLAKDEVKMRSRPAESRVGWCRWTDGDTSWFNNPQYRIRVNETKGQRTSANVFVSLLQHRSSSTSIDDNAKPTTRTEQADAFVSTNVVIIRKSRKWNTRVWELSEHEIVATTDDTHQSSARQEVSIHNVELVSGYTYFVVPFTTTRALERAFTLRLFTSSTAPLSVHVVEKTHREVLRGRWQRSNGGIDTTGGPLEIKTSRKTNSRWSRNPQYALYLPPWRKERTNVKLVVKRVFETSATKSKRKNGRSNRTNRSRTKIGICATLADPMSTVVRPKRPKAPSKRALLSDASLDMTTSKNRTSLSKSQLADATSASGAFEVNRKCQVQREEWTVMSSFHKSSEGCLLLRDLSSEFCENALIVVPMLENDETGKYQIEVYSDLPVTLRPLSEARTRAMTGRWSKGHCGGCHIDETKWRTNPKFGFKLHGIRGQPADVNISLTRSSDRWHTNTTRDPVKSMIGFYILPARKDGSSDDAICYDKTTTFKTNFVPLDKVSTPSGFTMEIPAENEHFLIVPCTYGEGEEGPFALTVKSNVGFSFIPI